jgi:hypothetical protein
MTFLEKGVHTAPYTSLCRRPILLAIGAGGVLLASVVVRDDKSEDETRAQLERLLAIYEPPR